MVRARGDIIEYGRRLNHYLYRPDKGVELDHTMDRFRPFIMACSWLKWVGTLRMDVLILDMSGWASSSGKQMNTYPVSRLTISFGRCMIGWC